jgi:hypothetical protein
MTSRPDPRTHATRRSSTNVQPHRVTNHRRAATSWQRTTRVSRLSRHDESSRPQRRRPQEITTGERSVDRYTQPSSRIAQPAFQNHGQRPSVGMFKKYATAGSCISEPPHLCPE